MNKYQNYNYNAPQGKIGSLLMPDETIIWAGKPKKECVCYEPGDDYDAICIDMAYY